MIKILFVRICQLGAVAVLAAMAASPSLGGVDASGKAKGKVTQVKTASAARADLPTPNVVLREGKASGSSILIRLKQEAVTSTAVATLLIRENLKIGREFTSVSGLKRLVLAAGPESGSFTKQNLLLTIKNLQESGLFEYVEPDWQVHLLVPPTDSAFVDGSLWGLQNTGQNGGVSGIDINAVPAWDITSGSPTVVVGVIDTGIRYTHQDIAANMWTNPGELAGNGTDDDVNGYIDDVYGINAITGSGDPFDDNDHGTHVAGTIAASAFDSGQHVGVAYNVRLMALKFLDASGSGNASDAIECIDYAVAQGVDILNNSWGGGGYSQALRDAIQAAHDAEILFVAAAGNSAEDNDLALAYPASYDVPNVVAVSAIDRAGNLASFSSYGVTTVDIAAPGVAILSSTADTDSSYGTFNGTSMAAPHVAGVAALLASQYPAAGVLELKNRMLSTARPLGSLSGRVSTGGMVDAHASLIITADGNLELRANSASLLSAGESNFISISVSDLTPVTGATVTGNFGGNPPQPFLDNGLVPDVLANDSVYSATLIAPIGVATTSLNVAVTASGKNPASESFSYNIVSAPANDNFADGILLVAGTNQTTGTNQFASSEPGEQLNPSVAGGATVWWQWTAVATGDVTISTTGSSYDTTLAIYQGSSLGGLSLLGANDDSSGLQSAVTFSANSGSTYHIQVDGFAGNTGNIELNYPSPGGVTGAPVIVTQPVGRSIIVGDPFNLSVTATGDPTLIYQWSLDGVAIPSATEASYSVAAAANTDGGSYTVSISNGISSAISNPAFVSVEFVGLVPANDRFTDAESLPGTSGRVDGMNIRATGEAAEPNHALVSTPLASVWYEWTAPSNGTFIFDTFGSDYDTTLAVYTGANVGSLTEIASNDDAGGSLQSQISIIVAGGVTYWFVVDGYSSREGQVILNYMFTPDGISLENDDFADRIPLIGSITTTGANISATGELDEPNHAGLGISVPLASAWWSWEAPGDDQVTISTVGSNFDTTLAAYTGTAIDSLSEVASNDDFTGLTSQITFAVVAGTSYSIAVDGYGPSEGLIELAVNFHPDSSDTDGDGFLDSSDNCPDIANADQNDFDTDNMGDACDNDDDNDGMSDAIEIQHGFNPLDPSDAGQDADGDGISNLAEINAGTDPNNASDPPPPPTAPPTAPPPSGGSGGGGSLDLYLLTFFAMAFLLNQRRRRIATKDCRI